MNAPPQAPWKALAVIIAVTIAAAITMTQPAQAVPPVAAIAELASTAPGLSKPITDMRARRYTVTTTPVRPSDILNTTGRPDGGPWSNPSSIPQNCVVRISNNTANPLNIGGPDVDNTNKYYSICTTGCDETGPLTITSPSSVPWIRAASTSVAIAILIGGGCL